MNSLGISSHHSSHVAEGAMELLKSRWDTPSCCVCRLKCSEILMNKLKGRTSSSIKFVVQCETAWLAFLKLSCHSEIIISELTLVAVSLLRPISSPLASAKLVLLLSKIFFQSQLPSSISPSFISSLALLFILLFLSAPLPTPSRARADGRSLRFFIPRISRNDVREVAAMCRWADIKLHAYF